MQDAHVPDGALKGPIWFSLNDKVSGASWYITYFNF
jgi:hypothetical protein